MDFWSAAAARRAELAEQVRNRARKLPFDDLAAQYLILGGGCSCLELDAFVHVGTDLPDHELVVLDQAMWELIEFGE